MYGIYCHVLLRYRVGNPPVYCMGNYLRGNYPVTDGGYDDCVDLPEHDHTDPEAAGGSGEY